MLDESWLAPAGALRSGQVISEEAVRPRITIIFRQKELWQPHQADTLERQSPTLTAEADLHTVVVIQQSVAG
jgi:hypothetical protein